MEHRDAIGLFDANGVLVAEVLVGRSPAGSVHDWTEVPSIETGKANARLLVELINTRPPPSP